MVYASARCVSALCREQSAVGVAHFFCAQIGATLELIGSYMTQSFGLAGAIAIIGLVWNVCLLCVIFFCEGEDMYEKRCGIGIMRCGDGNNKIRNTGYGAAVGVIDCSELSMHTNFKAMLCQLFVEYSK